MATCANGHGHQVPGSTCSVCRLALPSPGMHVWGSSAAVQAHDFPPGVNVSAPTNVEPAPAPARRRFWFILAVAITAFIVAAGSTYFVINKPIPELSGLTQEPARLALAEAGFTNITTSEEFSDAVPLGLVISQNPSAGARVRTDNNVTFIISRGAPRVAPLIAGESASVASRTLNSLGLVGSKTYQVSDSVPEGFVISQVPAPGTVLEEGSEVILVVSSGPPYTTVTVKVDLFSVVLDSDVFSSCSEAMAILQAYFNGSSIEDNSGRTLSTLAGVWDPTPGNGEYFPCEAIGRFPRTSTQEGTYVFYLDPSNGGSSGISESGSALEANNWRFDLG